MDTLAAAPQPATGTPPLASPPGATPTVAIAAGGTGGHIYPGLALAAAVRRARPNARVLFLGTPHGMESSLVPPAGYPLHLVGMVPLARSAGWRRYALPAILARTAWQCRHYLGQERVDVVVSMGGYPSVAPVVGARLAGVPVLVHESNAVPGRANRLAAHLTSQVAVAFPPVGPPWAGWSSSRSDDRDLRVVGLPLNEAMRRFDRAVLRPAARARAGLRPATRFVVVSGGSQGSARLDRAALELARAWRDREDVRLLVKASRHTADELRRELRACGADAVAEVVPYVERMEDVYAAADLMICRAGAATVAELARAGVASVLIPYPHAPGDHQTRNAEVLARPGGAVVVPDDRTAGPGWCAIVDRLLDEPGRLASMNLGATRAATEDGADQLAGWALDLADRHVQSLGSVR